MQHKLSISAHKDQLKKKVGMEKQDIFPSIYAYC